MYVLADLLETHGNLVFCQAVAQIISSGLFIIYGFKQALSGFLTRSNKNQAVLPQKMVRGLKFCI